MLAVDPQHPERRNWREVIPQGEDAIDLSVAGRSVTLVGHRLIVRTLHDAHSRVHIYGLDGDAHARGAAFRAGRGGRLRRPRRRIGRPSTRTRASSLHRPSTATTSTAGRSSVFRAPQVAFDPRGFEQRQVFYRGKDGTRIPMLLAWRKGVKLAADPPLLLYGYGGFGLSTLPAFNPARIAWLEMGGVFAMANIRGGGEYGEAWHRAGMRTHKQVVFDDFIAAAEWLIAQRYTSRAPPGDLTGAPTAGCWSAPA